MVGIAETWFSDTSVPTIGEYALYRRDRGSLHGGVCIYVRNDVKSFEVLNVTEDDKGAGHIWCGISRGDDKILVGCMYRLPDSDSRVLRKLLWSIQRAKNWVDSGEFKSVIFCGDFNLPKVKWPETGFWVNNRGDDC